MAISTTGMRGAMAIAGMAALAGCMGGGSSGGSGTPSGGGSGVTLANFDTEFDRATSGRAPTSDMPVTGRADYSGTARAQVYADETQVGDLLGDMRLSVDFAAANSTATQTSAVSGTLGNIRGRIDGETVAYGGRLSSEHTEARRLGSLARTTTTEINIPLSTPIVTRTGELMVHFSGDLEVDGQRGPVVVQAGGSFIGSKAEAASGAIAGTWWSDNTSPYDYTLGGKFYIEQE